MNRLMMTVWICLSVFLATACAGCSSPAIFLDDASHCDTSDAAGEVSGDRPVFSSQNEVAVTIDAGMATHEDVSEPPHDAEASVADSPTMVVDASTVARDDVASVTDASPSLFGFEARVLAASTCHGRTLHLSDAYYRRGFSAWHLCYVTEDPHTRPDGGMTPPRPASIIFHVGRDSAIDLDPMIDADAPRTANPWTTSVAVAIPDDITTPRFNVMNVLDTDGILWALDNDAHGGLHARGTLRAWRVGPDGQQTEVMLQPLFSACGGTMGPSGFPSGNYVPQGLCPAALTSCMPGMYHCVH